MNQCGREIRGSYKIEKMLGRTGYGINYLAVDIDLPSHPKCVVKQLSLQTDNPQILSLAREMFDKEAKGFAYIIDTMVRQNCELRYKSAKEALIALSVADKTILPTQNESNSNQYIILYYIK